MDWAHKRKWLVISILVAFVLALLLIIGFSIFYKTPTCFDMRKDGEELGIDCGGSCSTVCTINVQSATVRFARTLKQSGRTDLIAYIDNPNSNTYAKDTHLMIETYGEDGSVVKTHITLTLLPGIPTPLYIPGISTSVAQRVFVTFDDGYPIWTKLTKPYQPPTITSIVIDSKNNSRIDATLNNQTAYAIENIPLVVAVYDAQGTVIAASQTIIPSLPAQGTAPVVFTWNEPFASTLSRVEITPLISLPKKL